MMGGIGALWKFRISKSFISTIQDCGHGGSLETLKEHQILDC